MAKKKSVFIIIGLIFTLTFIIIFINYNRFEHFTLPKEPDGVFSSPYTDKLAVVTDGQLTIYNEYGEARHIDTDFNIKYVYPLDDVAWVVDVDGNLYELTYKFVTEISISEVILTNVNSIECTPNSCAAISAQGELYVWGNNEYCELGISDNKYMELPTRVTYVENIMDFAFCNMDAILLTDDGNVYECGLVNQITEGCNIIEYVYVHEFTKIEELSGVKEIYGNNVKVAIHENNEITYWGESNVTEQGTLSMIKWNDTSEEYEKIGIYTFSSGAMYQLGMTDAGKVYYWGFDIINGNKGKDTSIISFPKKVKGINKADMIYAGCSVGYVKKGLDIYILKR